MHLLELKIPPPAVALIFGILMWVLTATEPSLALSLPWRTTAALMFLTAGFATSLAGLIEFRRAKTTVNPFTPEASAAIVTSGIYRFSRNPMYTGLLLALIGWAVWLDHLLAFTLLPFFVLYINRFQIQPEERALAAKFGAPFREYTRSVRRWL
jgi:protein-S-isoprenylcysteine O-methyltransferase Ste14